jgi:hypothetical protein
VAKETRYLGCEIKGEEGDQDGRRLLSSRYTLLGLILNELLPSDLDLRHVSTINYHSMFVASF